MQIVLPYPPSVNKIWRAYRGRIVLARAARNYRDTLCALRLALLADDPQLRFPLPPPLALSAEVFPPDHRKRDLDNILKTLLDALQEAQFLKDDNDIEELSLFRRPVEPPGKIILSLYTI